MKLIIQIPCYNEAETLPDVLAELPTTLPGIDSIETLIIDDGSADDTVAVAHAHGVDHVISHPRNLGLARAFQTGLANSLKFGADVIVHTDADNQYPGKYIADLVAPVVAGKADMVVGNRQVGNVAHFSPAKKALQKLGSRVVTAVSGVETPDAVSGFRAYSAEAALRFNILTQFSYTLDTLIQAGKRGLIVLNVPISVNPPPPPPLPFLMMGFGLLIRFAYFHFSNIGGHVQSVIIAGSLLMVGVLVLLFGIQADIAGKHRQLTQETLYRLKKLENDQLKTTNSQQKTEN